MTFEEFVKTFLGEIMGHPSYKLCSETIQLQVSHLSFVVNIISDYSEQKNTILELWKPVKKDLENGETSWEEFDYFKQWQDKVLKILGPEPSCEDEQLCPKDEENFEDEKLKSESVLINFSKSSLSELKAKKEREKNDGKEWKEIKVPWICIFESDFFLEISY